MILSAGRGERLRPLTDTTPKPLLPINGKPMIVFHLEKLAEAGVKEVVINHAWLGEQFQEALGNGEKWGLKIHYSAEPDGGLETAGGIIQALPLLGDQAFWLVNGDVFTDFDFSNLPRKLPKPLQAHCVLVPTPCYKAQGDFGLNQAGLVLPQGEWTFSGMSVFHPQFFSGLRAERLALAPLLREAMRLQQVSGQIYRGDWSDVGTPERLAQINQRQKSL
ncbi:nucleotidyltransferase family protein [Thiomicrospira microaerophila]|nr:nucleotidyltransferase family protein [Thiomicrospira microaerophila]